jgi:hypothetical protein
MDSEVGKAQRRLALKRSLAALGLFPERDSQQNPGQFSVYYSDHQVQSSSSRPAGKSVISKSSNPLQVRQEAACSSLDWSAHPTITAPPVAFTGDENASCAFAFSNGKVRP